MKRYSFLIWLIALGVGCVSAQTTSSQNGIHVKVTKEAKKEVKRLNKEGWIVAPREKTIEEQVNDSFFMQEELDENQTRKYLTGIAVCKGNSYDDAKMKASELARQDLASQILTEVVSTIESNLSNLQVSATEFSTIEHFVMESKTLVCQKLGRTIPVMTLYRPTSDRKTEVLIRVAYEKGKAHQLIRETVIPNMEEQDNRLRENLIQILE